MLLLDFVFITTSREHQRISISVSISNLYLIIIMINHSPETNRPDDLFRAYLALPCLVCKKTDGYK